MERPVDIARRGLRELLPAPPWRLATVTKGWGFQVERDVDARDGVDEGVLVASLQIGNPDLPKPHIRVPASDGADFVLVNLAYVDPVSAAWQLQVPDDAWDREPDDIDLGPRQPCPVWMAPLGRVTRSMGAGYRFPHDFGRPPARRPAGRPEDHAQALQLETHLQLIAAAEDLRRQLDRVEIPDLDSLAAGMEETLDRGGDPAWDENVRARALAFAVRGRLPEALRIVAVSHASRMRSTVDPTWRADPHRVPFLLDTAARLERFAAWLVATFV